MKLLELVIDLRKLVAEVKRVADALDRISPPPIEEGPPTDIDTPGVITSEINRNWEYYADN